MMNSNNQQQDSLSELRSGMEALKSSLSAGGLITDPEIRHAMRAKSAWLNRVVIGEIITLPIIVFFLFAMSHFTGMNIWLAILFLIAALPDVILDIRTLGISKKWIQDETLISLTRKLIRQKKERQVQTIISTSLCMPWLCWFAYDYLKRNSAFIPDESFFTVWIIMSAICIVTSLCIIILIYKKAQKTNDEMISRLNTFTEDE